ncbi:hypothetical protein OBBRIDRAFT_797106 [Obba rivulosa]|uniref:Uncharacterized protein n=1 Tax=Obba rivulosa TaxID=1052685 RepID=A0A8E2DH17_9APHY|nr:hypothetical protein OBBRIDRAFT_797106 [Obba rivulosa]
MTPAQDLHITPNLLNASTGTAGDRYDLSNSASKRRASRLPTLVVVADGADAVALALTSVLLAVCYVMPQQPESATPISIRAIKREHASRKLRVAGRVLCYDADSATLTLADGDVALFVDVSLCVSTQKPMGWLWETNNLAVALGYLERVLKPLPLPTLPVNAPNTVVDPRLILRALVLNHSPDLNLALWNVAAEKLRQAQNGQEVH